MIPSQVFVRRVVHRAFAGAFLLAGAYACTGTSERSPVGATTRDSAGVSIVEHSAVHMVSLPEWTLDSVPLQELRGDQTDAQFARVLDAEQRSDGGFYVADQQHRDI